MKPQAPIRFACTGCGSRLKVPSTAADKSIRCPRCRQVQLVPALEMADSPWYVDYLHPTTNSASAAPPASPARIQSGSTETAVTPVPRYLEESSNASWSTLELSWVLHDLIENAYWAPFAAHFSGQAPAQDLDAYLAARDIGWFRQLCITGIAKVHALTLPPAFPETIRNAVRSATGIRDRLLAGLEPAGCLLTDAAARVSGTLGSSGLVGVFHKAARVLNPSSNEGMAAAGGRLIGGVLLSTVGLSFFGQLLGSVAGAAAAAQQAGNRNRAVLQQFDAAVKQVLSDIRDVHFALWAHVVERTAQAGGPKLKEVSHFTMASQALTEINDRYRGADIDVWLKGRFYELEQFLRAWGPQREALVAYCTHGLGMVWTDKEGGFPHKLDAMHALCIRLYPNEHQGYQISAMVALERNEPARAMELADQGLRLTPSDRSLHSTRLEAAAIVGDHSMAEASFAVLTQQDQTHAPWVTRIRGLLRGSRFSETESVISKWLATGFTPAAILRALRRDTKVGPATEELRTTIPALRDLPRGVDTDLRGILETFLWDDGNCMHLTHIPKAKIDIITAEFLTMLRGEMLLFLYDWNFWGTSKTGFAITTLRVVWKCTWEDSVSITFDSLTSEQVSYKKTELIIGPMSVDLEDETMASCFACALREVVETVRSIRKV
jgi:DNA-directed RNA polymerase subunit RPC12/RpoP